MDDDDDDNDDIPALLLQDAEVRHQGVAEHPGEVPDHAVPVSGLVSES